MSTTLKISAGQYSDKGRKPGNQDFHGMYVPREPQLTLKGVAIALADGISSSDVSHIASESAVKGFLEDYYCTAETWSVKKSAQRVLTATNSWLHSQTRRSQYRYDAGRGYVCTLSALIIKATTAHVFHVGDSRVYRMRGDSLDQLTEDHRISVAPETSYLTRALGMDAQLEIDYRTLPVERGDVFVLATDGVYEYVAADFVIATVVELGGDLDAAARRIVAEAYRRGSADNLTVQIVRVDAPGGRSADEIQQRVGQLPCPPVLDARTVFDGYTIIRELHASNRSHVYLALDGETGARVVIKTPSVDLRDDPAYLERFLMEEWIARRLNTPHVHKPCLQTRQRSYLYIVNEFVDGQTLTQWIFDHPKPELKTVRDIVAQIANGVQAFHRMEMLHQDLRPDNIMIDRSGTAKIIDFGAALVAGLNEMAPAGERTGVLGTVQYAAPEYFLGETGTARADIFSLGVIAYQMLTGKLPYGAAVAQAKTAAAQRKLRYRSVRDFRHDIPHWIDVALKKALEPAPLRRYAELSEFMYDLRNPNKALMNVKEPPLIERNPLIFWQAACFILTLAVLVLLSR